MLTPLYALLWKTLHRLQGDDPLPFADALDAQQWQSAESLRGWQQARLLEIVQQAYDRVPFYRQRIDAALGGRPAAPIFPDDWRRIAILRKEELRVEGQNLVADRRRDLIRSTTSGSTGTPVTVWREPEFLGHTRAIQRRALQWYGVEPWSRAFLIGGVPGVRWRLWRQKLLSALTGRVVCSSYDLAPARLQQLLRKIRRQRPALIGGYTNAVYHLARAADEAGIRMDDIGVKVVAPISEQTEEFHEQLFRKVFGAPVFIEYGCVEVGAMAYRCPHGRLHISHEHTLFEVVDDLGQPAPPGTVGRVILTPLLAKAMPLIRYDIGDLASLSVDSCPCGRHPGLPTIEQIAGRSMDIVVGRGGHPWHGNVFYYAFKTIFDVRYFREFQGLQSEIGKAHLLIVPGAEFRPEHAERFANAAMQMMDHTVEVTWETVDHIQREGSGKLKYFRSLLPAEIRQMAGREALQ